MTLITGECRTPEPSDSAVSLVTKLDTVLQSVEKIGVNLEQTRTSLENRIDKATSDFDLLHADHRKLVNRVHDVEHTPSEIQVTTCESVSLVKTLMDCVRTLDNRAEDAEGHARQNNIQVACMLKGVEGMDAVASAETWICDLLTSVALSPFFTVESAHLVPSCHPALILGLFYFDSLITDTVTPSYGRPRRCK
ncbi:hypothetical protein NDU88_003653 [Pleurodeles waltl]|uniref:Uncharacterized protein n=1 Tax=Pleurodeles waltl TaxID=8319 RepID=A0AAV7WTN8_PLEWA|nr:hypothetical protein NDU88_003653 [Pleurodeles waltl]